MNSAAIIYRIMERIRRQHDTVPSCDSNDAWLLMHDLFRKAIDQESVSDIFDPERNK